MLAARRWRALIDLVTELPATSRLTDALVNDEEYAAAIVEQIPDLTESSPTLTSVAEETLQVQILRDLFDLIASALGAKGRYPRPVTAVDRARTHLVESSAEALIEQLTPWAQSP